MSHTDAPNGATTGVAAAAPQGGTVSRSRDNERHERNVKLRLDYIETLAEIEATNDPQEKARLQDRLGRIGNEFVEANSGLIGNMVRVFNPHQGNSEDYRGYAAQGLWEAFTKWDPERSTFATFSRPFLSGRLQRAVRRWEHSHLTQQEWADRARASKVRNKLAVELGRDPTPAEIAEKTGYDPGSVERMFTAPVRSLEDRADITEDRDANLSDDMLPDVADLVGEDEDIEILLTDLNGIELMAAMFSNDALNVVPRKLAHVAQSVGLGRNQLGKAAVSGTTRLTRSVLRKRLGQDPDPDMVAREMGLGERVPAIAAVLRKTLEPGELRSAHVRGRRHLAMLSRRGSSTALLRAAESQIAANEDRIHDLIAEVVNVIANCYEQNGPDGWMPAEPEPIADTAWAVFVDTDTWPHTATRTAFLRSVKERLPDGMRPIRRQDEAIDEVNVDRDWVRRRVRR